MREITLTIRLTDAEVRAISRQGSYGAEITDAELAEWLRDQAQHEVDEAVEDSDSDD